ncbi:MAG: hypothetical protein KC470_06375 [Dehalococcoidia bacterium]|nr:hypothetical protein [Dehalococcoidia bacterium]
MLDEPPDRLVVQTHSAAVAEHTDLLVRLSRRCQLRVHLSIETDRERFAGLPPHGSSIQSRFEAAGQLRESGLKVVITVSPLLPLEAPEGFFKAIDQVAAEIGLHPDGIELLEYTVTSVTEGIDALGEVSVRVRSKGEDDDQLNPQREDTQQRVYHGHGTDTDIIVASAKAYLSALNRLVAAKAAQEKAA